MTQLHAQPPQAVRSVPTARKYFSLAVLLIVLAILAIEVRASLGQKFSGEKLQGFMQEDLLSGIDLPTAQNSIVLFPSVTTIRDNDVEVVYRYEWLSLLRQPAGRPPAELFLVVRKNPLTPVTFYTDRVDAEAGFWGDPAEAEEPEVLPLPDSDNPRGIQDYAPDFSSQEPSGEGQP